jgi:membrane-bound ClpP family serine protease
MLLPELNSVSFEYDTKTVNAAGEYLLQRLAWLCGSLIFSCVIIVFLARYVLPSFSTFNPFVLVGHEQEASKGYVAAGDTSQFPPSGSIGQALTPLRPAGKATFNDNIFDAISTGEFIEAGQTVVVHHLEGNVIFVQINQKFEQQV